MALLPRAPTMLPGVTHPPPHRLLALIAGVALMLHGAIHLMGFVVDWQVAVMQTLPYRTTVLGGNLDLGAAGIRSLGVLWLVAALGFIAVGTGLAWQAKTWQASIVALALLSFILCILTWPDSAFGAVFDAAILAALVVYHGKISEQRAQQGTGHTP